MARYGFRKSTLMKRRRFTPKSERLPNKRYRGSTYASNSNKMLTGQGVTEQHDTRTIYRKKNMPYKKKRRWKRFVRQVHFVAEKDLGTQTVVFNKSISGQDGTGQQIAMDISLYSLKSVNTVHNDLFQIQSYFNTGNPTAVVGETTDLTTKFLFHSAVLDMTVRNSSFTSTSGATSLAPNANVEVDVYELTAGVYFNTFRTAAPTEQVHGIVQFINEYAIDTKEINGTGTGIALTSRGCTPFDLPSAVSAGKIKILRKTKYQLSSGQCFTYQMRDARRHVMNKNAILDALSANRPGWTRWILVIAKGVPGVTYGEVDGTVRTKIDIGITRKYMLKVEGMNDTRDRYLTNT